MLYNDELCRKNLKRLVDWYKEKEGERNEATTRLTMIDKLFFECLGWSKDDVLLEEYYNKEYTDYTFNAPRRIMIVEAKKEGEYFEVPVGTNRLEHSLSTLMHDNVNLKSAVEQAAHYCQTRGVPVGVICNGHQLVVFIATRNDGASPLEGRALVFLSLQFMLDNFLDFWEALSKPGIEEKKIFSRLIGDKLPELPPKLSMAISSYPGIKRRNIFQTDLQILSELVIEDVARSRDIEKQFLEECYCKSGALSQYTLISRKILQARYAALFEESRPSPTTLPASNKDGITHELLAQSLSRRPILLIGDVGVGKTAFIRNLIKVEEPSLFEDSVTFYIDFGTQATLTADIKEFVAEELAMQLREAHNTDTEERNFVRGIYHLELERFKKGIYKDLYDKNRSEFLKKELEFLEDKLKNKEAHLKASLEHITKARRKQIIMFLDNADQRDDNIQEQVFLIAQEFASHWPLTTFVTIRPETFHRSMRIGALSGYHPKAFTISPPRIDKVIEKRLQFALKITGGKIPLKAISGGMLMKVEKLDSVIRVFLNSLKYKDEVLAECIDNISGGNVRLGLDLVRIFLGSGHVNTEKIVKIYERSGKYFIPLHEFLRAVIYGDAEHYDHLRSAIGNLFDVSKLDRREHFLLPILISFLATSGESGISESGFIDTNRVYDRLQGLGFIPEQIDVAIIKAFRKKLIETSARRLPEAGRTTPQALRATTVGVYHIERLSCLFLYIDAIIVDTCILNDKVREKIRNVGDIISRLDRAEVFLQYMDDSWLPMKSLGTSFDWDNVSEELKKNIKFIRDALEGKKEKSSVL